jgi:hypothetical protein
MAAEMAADPNSPDGTPVPKPSTEVTEQSKSLEKPPEISIPLPRPILSALEKVPDQDAKAILSVALSRTTFGFGPDPETAKTLAQAEIHEEECRLKTFQN